MKNFHGMAIPYDTELFFLSIGYEWIDEETYQMIKSDRNLEYQIQGVDRVNGKNELYLIKASTRGYRIPRSNTGCRLRTGSPDSGR